ncbi:unnamed protein product [Rotaria socialis]|uniref:EGF-like domain-containing protein n=2 Tax=Rotaria socialis TaxID=392032 RepID=A0A821BDJ5_9BILA|nr:unnamed protein product [Rotaria socialis]CAF4589325.1 unnamed protein product [Rotaria socialis]
MFWTKPLRDMKFSNDTYGRVLLYNTENGEAFEKFDCVYYTYNDGEEISYCRRPGGSQTLVRNRSECDNQGQKKYFRDLLDQKIHPSEILNWSSSVEMVDLYARAFYNRSLIDDNDDRFVCNCTNSGTFGKYCEYKLTHEAKFFSEAINAQFEQKENGDEWNTQRYGKILCYETLSCLSSPLCLDWREICDSFQRCSNGTDEENCDKLEFNECEYDEFRCTNGMCIAEEFWLDGDNDCMDWSDEYFSDGGDSCQFHPNAIECDEHTCSRMWYSCGDGQCVQWSSRMDFNRFESAKNDCFTKRNRNYMCEASSNPPAWTLESGLCWPDKDYDDPRYPPWNLIIASNLTNKEKCQYLFRCALSKGLEHDCPCNHSNCTPMMMSVCSSQNYLILYPPAGLINPNVLIYYNYSQFMENPSFQIFLLSGGIKCRGYFFQTKYSFEEPFYVALISYPLIHHKLCHFSDPIYGNRDFLSPIQNDKFCWNDSLTFNGRPYAVNLEICPYAGECISQYRIHDGTFDCLDASDEIMILDKNYCTGNAGRHRFQCFDDDYACLPLSHLGRDVPSCSNSYDKNWHGTGGLLRIQLLCSKTRTTHCHHLKAYIQQSSAKNSSNNASLVSTQRQESKKLIAFRSYCDTFWNLDNHIDELSSSCQHWVCEHDRYRCRTGQCILLDWVCDGEWDCADASDEEAIVLNQPWTIHNAHLTNLPSQLEKCRERYSKPPFWKICNTSFEFGCYLSRVSNPLDIQSNTPCINLTQIGDGVEDCYNAHDEKNTFTAKTDNTNMWGFHFRCGSEHRSYVEFCSTLNCTEILCSKYRDKDGSCSNKKDAICHGDDRCKKNARCDGIVDCEDGEDEYWCPSGSLNDQRSYRFGKRQILDNHIDNIYLITYPPESMVDVNQQQVPKSSINLQNDSFFKVHSYQCNRGIAVLQMNETRCLCPPAYYGRWCEFFSDRISIIAHLDQNTLLTTMSKVTLKIKANFLFNNRIIDHHEFTIIPTFERVKIIKHKFYLVYSRSAQMLVHKQRRYFNRTDVINNHPYSVHFDVFSLENENSIKEIGSWHYPIYFDYLPAFRLAIVLRFPSWLENTTHDACWQNRCNENSTCMPVFNQNNSYYCSCKSGYYGTNCSMYEYRCGTYCSVKAFCRPDHYDLQVKRNNPYCICALGHFGPHCNFKYDYCDSSPCLNNGTCLPNYDRSGEQAYMCNCSQQFYGNQCENEMAFVRVILNITRAVSARATIVQLYSGDASDLPLSIQHQKAYYGLPSMINYYHSSVYAPEFGFLKIYEDLSDPQYFIIYCQVQRMINITSSPQNCPHALSLLSEMRRIDESVPAIFKYHNICRNDTQHICFYDENYICICQPDHYGANCFIHDTQLDHCDKCLSGGKCLQGDPKDLNDFICLCPSCHQGHRFARSRAKTVGQRVTFSEVLKKQFKTQKELYVTPTIAVISVLPQIILTFSFACTPLSDWQRHTLLATYLLSYAPQVLGFILHVLPSTNYKKEFNETFIAKKVTMTTKLSSNYSRSLRSTKSSSKEINDVHEHIENSSTKKGKRLCKSTTQKTQSKKNNIRKRKYHRSKASNGSVKQRKQRVYTGLNGKYWTSQEKSTTTDIYNPVAGQSEIIGVHSYDKHGNPVGTHYDLGRDGAFNRYCVLIGQFYSDSAFSDVAMQKPIDALMVKGFQVKHVKSETEFLSELSTNLYRIVWVISSSSIQDPTFDVALIKFHASGGAIFLFADNVPYITHASNFLNKRFGITLTGCYGAQLTLTYKEKGYLETGHFGQHDIFTGITNLYEGHTICQPVYSTTASCSALTVLATSTDGNPNIAVFDPPATSTEGRLSFDSGFTKLYINWDDAGTARYIVNTTCWLAGIGGQAAMSHL